MLLSTLIGTGAMLLLQIIGTGVMLLLKNPPRKLVCYCLFILQGAELIEPDSSAVFKTDSASPPVWVYHFCLGILQQNFCCSGSLICDTTKMVKSNTSAPKRGNQGLDSKKTPRHERDVALLTGSHPSQITFLLYCVTFEKCSV